MILHNWNSNYLHVTFNLLSEIVFLTISCDTIFFLSPVLIDSHEVSFIWLLILWLNFGPFAQLDNRHDS